MNEYDTEIVLAILKEKYEHVESPEIADIILLNTCSVRENATRKIVARVHQLRHLQNGKKKKIGLLGCMSTNLRSSLLKDKNLPIDFIAGPDSYKRLAKLIENNRKTDEKMSDLRLSRSETYSNIHPFRTKGVNAWIAVMRGCDNYCTFCVVPYTRGRERSRPISNILEEVERLAQQGYQQVTLLGQNVNSYKHDGKDFAYLLNKVSEVDQIKRIRFTSPHPKDFPETLIKTVAKNPKVCKHIHLPLQAGNDRILDMMNRTYTQKDYLLLVDKIRNHSADIVLTTDIIIGFPTETDHDFKDTVKVVNKVEFNSAYIFKYSQRKGTIAARKFPDDVSEEAKTERIIHLNEIQKKISLKKNSQHIGRIEQILIEASSTKKSDTDVQGRNDGNILVIIPKERFEIGDFVGVKIIDASANVLKGVSCRHQRSRAN